MNFKKTILLSTIVGMSSQIFAQDESAEETKPLEPITTIGTGEMFEHIDMKKVASDLDRRQKLKIEQDLLTNESAVSIARMDSLRNLNEEETLNYIRENVPMEVRVLGQEKAMAWLQAQYEQQVDGLGKNIVWTSSEQNIFVPRLATQQSVTVGSTKENVTSLSENDMAKLEALNNPAPTAPQEIARPEPVKVENEQSANVTERRFVTPQRVEASNVMLLGNNKSFTGVIGFKVNLNSGQDDVNSSFNDLEIGDQFSVQGKNFVLSDISSTRLTLIDMESNESHYLTY